MQSAQGAPPAAAGAAAGKQPAAEPPVAKQALGAPLLAGNQGGAPDALAQLIADLAQLRGDLVAAGSLPPPAPAVAKQGLPPAGGIVAQVAGAAPPVGGGAPPPGANAPAAAPAPGDPLEDLSLDSSSFNGAESYDFVVRSFSNSTLESATADFREAAARIRTNAPSLPENCKWANVKPNSLRKAQINVDVLQSLIDGINVFSRNMLVELSKASSDPNTIIADFTYLCNYLRENIRAQLALAKLTADAPAADKVAAESYRKLFDPVNPATPTQVKAELDMRGQILSIALSQEKLLKAKARTGGSSFGNRSGSQHHHHQQPPRGGGRGGSRGGRGGHASSSGNGAPAGSAPAAQQ